MEYKVISGVNEANIELFMKLEKKVYLDDDNRIFDTREELNSFIKRYDKLDINIFIIINDDNEPISRSCIVIDPLSKKDTKIAMFSHFETMDDEEAVKLLIKSLCTWAEQQGAMKIMGPMSDNVASTRGLLLEGTGKPVFFMPYNPLYYNKLLKQAGFKIAKKMLEFIIEVKPPYTKIRKAAEFVKKKNPEIKLRPLNLDNLASDIKNIASLYNRAWTQNWGFREMIWEDFYNAAYPFKDLLRYSSVVTLNEKFIGFQVIVPDINACYSNGRYDLTKLPNIDVYRGMFFGVDPDFRMKGIDALMYDKVFNQDSEKAGIRKLHLGWVQEDNYKMARQLRNIGGESTEYKYYALYEKSIHE
ncbi:hypothetical protein ACVR1G_05655 [Streptococcus dentasini]